MDEIPFIDANIILRFLVIDRVNPSLSQQAKRIVNDIRLGKITVQTTILTIAEIVYVLERLYTVTKENVVSSLEPLVALDNLNISGKALLLEALRIYQEKNIDFEDAYTYVSMVASNTSEIYTFDTKHFKRFTDITILP